VAWRGVGQAVMAMADVCLQHDGPLEQLHQQLAKHFPKSNESAAAESEAVRFPGKRGKSAYIYYSSSIRDSVRQAHPDTPLTELTKVTPVLPVCLLHFSALSQGRHAPASG
jgi:hypothetical protein